jgi:hypothetical protein
MPSFVAPRHTWYSSRLAKPNLIVRAKSSDVCAAARVVRIPFNIVRATDPVTLRHEQIYRLLDECQRTQAKEIKESSCPQLFMMKARE